MPRPLSSHPDAAVGQQRHVDGVAVAGQRLVDRVVDHLVDQVVQAALAGRADVHAGALADRLEALQHGDGRGAVLRRDRAQLRRRPCPSCAGSALPTTSGRSTAESSRFPRQNRSGKRPVDTRAALTPVSGVPPHARGSLLSLQAGLSSRCSAVGVARAPALHPTRSLAPVGLGRPAHHDLGHDALAGVVADPRHQGLGQQPQLGRPGGRLGDQDQLAVDAATPAGSGRRSRGPRPGSSWRARRRRWSSPASRAR